MATISSSAGYQAVTQAAYRQLKVQQAKQNADKAEQVARSLAQKASEAQQVADNAQDNARSLTVQSSEAQTVAGQARQGLAMLRSVSVMQADISTKVDQVVEKVAAEPVQPPVEVKSSAVSAYSSSQEVGTLVDTSA